MKPHPFIITSHALFWTPPKTLTPVLSDIHLQIPENQVTAIVGPNGAGKTSLLKCLLGLQKAYQGSVFLQGQSLSEYSRGARAKALAYVSQLGDVIADLTVMDLVKMGCLPHTSWYEMTLHSQEDSLIRALTLVGMLPAAKRKLAHLSGGELQRVLIARALVQKPKVLILDEPTNHLDVYYQHQILHLLQSLGISVVLTLHDLNLAAQYSDYVVLMHQGRVKKQGGVAEVFQAQTLSEVFGLPCDVTFVQQNQRSVPRVSFNPEFKTENQTLFQNKQTAEMAQDPASNKGRNPL